jgi:hypothetical protein
MARKVNHLFVNEKEKKNTVKEAGKAAKGLGEAGGCEKTPSLHRLGGGVQQEFEHSLWNRDPLIFLRIG